MASFYSSAALKALKLKLSTKKVKENQPLNSEGQTEFKRPVLKNNVSLMSRNKTTQEKLINDSNFVCSNLPNLREECDQEDSFINAEEQNQNAENMREEYQEMVDQVRDREAENPAESQRATAAPEFSFAIPQTRPPKPARPSTLDIFSNFKQTVEEFYNNDILTDCEVDYFLLKLTSYAQKTLAKFSKHVRSSEDDGFSQSALMDCFQRTGIPPPAPSLVGSCNSYMGYNRISRFSVGNRLQNSSFQPIHQPSGERESDQDTLRQFSSHGLSMNIRRPSLYQMPRYRSSILGSECGDSVISGPYCRSSVSYSRPRCFNYPFEQDRIAPFDCTGAGKHDRRVDVAERGFQMRNPDMSDCARDLNKPRSSNNYNSQRIYSSQVPDQSQYLKDRNFIAPNRPEEHSLPKMPISERRSFISGAPATSRYGRVIRTPCFYKINDGSSAHNKADISMKEASFQRDKNGKLLKMNDNVGVYAEERRADRSSLLTNSYPVHQSICKDRPNRNFIAPNRPEEQSLPKMSTSERRSFISGTPATSRYGRVLRTPCFYKINDHSSAQNKADISMKEASFQRNKDGKLLKNGNVGVYAEERRADRSSLLTNSYPVHQSICKDRPIRSLKRKREDSATEGDKQFCHTPDSSFPSKENETCLRTKSGRIIREPSKFWSQEYSSAGRTNEERLIMKRKRSSTVHHGKTLMVYLRPVN